MRRHVIVFCLVCLLSPSFWLIVSQPQKVVNEWKLVSGHIQKNWQSTSRAEYANRIIDLRWGGTKLHRESVLLKIIYNPGISWVNQIFEFVEFSAPKLFFLSGDGGPLSPRLFEPILVIFFPLWIIGIIHIISSKNWFILVLVFVTSAIGFVLGKRSFEVLFFAYFIHCFIATIGIIHIMETIWKKRFH